MPIYSIHGHTPRIDRTAWVAPSASLIGEVTLEEGASVWFNAVIRADCGPIVIRAGANVQDGSVLHCGPSGAEVGPGVTIGHACMVHSAVLNEGALIGNHATVLDGAIVGARSLVAAGSVVPPRMIIPADVLAVGSPARVRGPLSDGQRSWLERDAPFYRNLAQTFAEDLVQCDDSRVSG